MKNKKGFTLIELLVIVIILALLILLAVPATLKTIRQAREKSFIIQAKSIAKAAQQKYELDSFTSSVKTSYGTGELSLSSSSSSLFYCVNLNQNGSFKNIKVFDTNQKLKVQGTSFDNMEIVEYVEGETLVCDGTYDPGVTPGQSSSEVCTTDCPSSSDVPEVDQSEAPCEDCGPVSNVPVPISNGDGSFYIYTVGYFKKVNTNSNTLYRYSFTVDDIGFDLTKYDFEVESSSLMTTLEDFSNYKQFKQQYSSRLVNNSNTNSDAVATAEELYNHRATSSELTVNHVYISCGKDNCIISIDAEAQLTPNLNWHSTTTNGGTNIDVIYPGIKIKIRPVSTNVVFSDKQQAFYLGGTIIPSEYTDEITEDAYIKVIYNNSNQVTNYAVCHVNGICLKKGAYEANKLLLLNKFGEESTYHSNTTKCYVDSENTSIKCGGNDLLPYYLSTSSGAEINTKIISTHQNETTTQRIYGACGMYDNVVECKFNPSNLYYFTSLTTENSNQYLVMNLMGRGNVTLDYTGDNVRVTPSSHELVEGLDFDYVTSPTYGSGIVFYDVLFVTDLQSGLYLQNDIVIVAKKIQQFDLTLNVTNGTATTASAKVTSGNTGLLVGEPSNEYYIYDTVTCDGTHGTVTYENGEITVANVTSDVACTLTYKLVSYDVSVSVTNGNVTKSQFTIVRYGSDTTTITANSGYTLDDAIISCDPGINAGISGTTLTLSNILTNGSCSIILKPVYTVTTTVTGGTIASNQANQSIAQGNSTTITTSANTDFAYGSYSCSGNATKTINNGVITLTNVQSDITCSVTYLRQYNLYISQFEVGSTDSGEDENTSFQVQLNDGRIVTVDYNADAGDESDVTLSVSSGTLVQGTDYQYVHSNEYGYELKLKRVSKIGPTNLDGHIEIKVNNSYIPIDDAWYDITNDTHISILKVQTQNCIDTETLVTMADGSLKKLGDIEVGDEVLSVDWNTKKLISRKVIYSGKDNYDDWKVNAYWENKFSDGTIIKQAMKHRFYTLETESFVYLHEWTLGLHTYKIDGTNPTLVSRKLVQGKIHYGRITLEDDNNYFANGLLTGDRRSQAGIPLTEFLPRG